MRSAYRLIGAETREVDMCGNTGYFLSNLIGILDAMPANIPIALEVPMERLTSEIGPEARRAPCARGRRARDGPGHEPSLARGGGSRAWSTS